MARIIKKINVTINERGIITTDIKIIIIIKGILRTICINLVIEMKNSFFEKHNLPKFIQEIDLLNCRNYVKKANQ